MYLVKKIWQLFIAEEMYHVSSAKPLKCKRAVFYWMYTELRMHGMTSFHTGQETKNQAREIITVAGKQFLGV